MDVVDALPTLMGGNDLPNLVRCAKVLGDLMTRATKPTKKEHPRVAACGECAPSLLTEGKVEAAIQLEHLTDVFARSHDIDILCGYLRTAFSSKQDSSVFERICAEHSCIQ